MSNSEQVSPHDILDNPESLVDMLDSNVRTFVNMNEPVILKNSPYYTNTGFKNLLKTKRHSFNIVSLNSQSLNAKYEEIKCLITSYNEDNCIISALCIQETWLQKESDLSLLQLDGYNLISKGKSCSAHGGVAIYLHESYKFNILEYSDSEYYDGLFIEISLDNDLVAPVIDRQKLIIGNIYRPPRQLVQDLNRFINEVEIVFAKLVNARHVVITGDFNINLLKYQDISSTNDFFESLMSNSYLPKITWPTRLTHRKGTLIDNFFVKISDKYSCTTAGIVLSAVSDHLPYFLSLDYLFNRNKKIKYITNTNINHHSITNFKTDLNSINVVNKLNDIIDYNSHSSYSRFHEIMQSLINNHFPIKHQRFNKYLHKKSNWVTKGILRSISFRDKMYLRLKSTQPNNPQYETLQFNLKTYNKILKKIIRQAKKDFYLTSFQNNSNNIKKTWNTINDIINKKKKNNDLPDSFLIDGAHETDATMIAQNFNKYFVEIGPKLAASIQLPNDKNFKDYLLNPCNQNFLFSKVDIPYVEKIIDSLKPKSSCGIDRLSTNLLKSCKSELARPLMLIFNQCVETGEFPDSLKIAKVIPIYKKD